MTSIEPTLWDETDAKLVPAIAEAASGGEVAELVELGERARDYARNSKAANTLRAYESDLRHFGAWCEDRGLVAFPATGETVAYYLTDHGGVPAVSTLRRRLAAISEAHKRDAIRIQRPIRRCALCGTAFAVPTARRPRPRRRPSPRSSPLWWRRSATV